MPFESISVRSVAPPVGWGATSGGATYFCSFSRSTTGEILFGYSVIKVTRIVPMGKIMAV
jgi:hypothetical protein